MATNKNMALSFLAAWLLALAVTGAEGETLQHTRKLMQPKKNLPFPFMTCVKAGRGSPYLLSGPVPTIADGVMNITLTIVANPEADTSAPCMPAISNDLRTIVFRTGALCEDSIKGIFINGFQKTRGIKWENVPGQDDSTLALNGLNIRAGTIGSTVTLLVQGACNTPAGFTGPRVDGRLVYFISNTPQAECCPVNSWDWGLTYGQPIPATPGILTIRTTLDPAAYTPAAVSVDQTSPLSSLFQIPAANAALAGAGTLSYVTDAGVTPEVTPTAFGAVTSFTFPVETLAFLSGDYLIKKGFTDFIAAAQVPCNSVITISSSTRLLASFGCTSREGQYALNDLCVRNNKQVCLTPGSFPVVEEGSNQEGSEGSAEESFDSAQEGSEMSAM